MYFGQNFGSGFGYPELQFRQPTTYALRDSNTKLRVTLSAAPGFAGWWGVYANAKIVASLYCDENDTVKKFDIPLQDGKTYSVDLLRQGHAKLYDSSRVVRNVLQVNESERVRVSWAWAWDVIGIAGNTDLTGWSLTGLEYESLEPQEMKTRRALTVNMITSAGTTTVTLKLFDTIVASGTVTAPGTCTLAEQNDSDISGTVTVAATPTDIADETLVVRYPKSMRIYRDSVQQKNYLFNSSSTASWAEPQDLSAGTYAYTARYVSDTDDEGTLSSADNITIQAVPGKPTNLAYVSGDQTATVISWTASPTAGASYNIYVQNVDDDFTDFVNPTTTAPAGSTSVTLPAITGGEGDAYVIVRAVLSGVEEQNLDALLLEYDNTATHEDLRPNDATINSWSVENGTTLDVVAVYNPEDELETPNKLLLATRTPSGSYNWAAPDATTTINVNGTPVSATLQVTGLSNGWHYFAVKAKTSAGMQSENPSTEILFYVDNTDLSAPTFTTENANG